jgi:nitronate monooxygenase
MALTADLRERLTLPAFAAPMFLCSGVELATACCEAGIIGSLTRNHCRDLAELEVQLQTVTGELARFADEHPGRKIGPLAVNISPTFGMNEMKAHLNLCRRHGVRIIVTSVGDPTVNAPLIQDAGILHYHDATTMRFAEKAVAAGVDGIVAIGAGGGGHAGTISYLAFIPLIRAMFDGTIATKRLLQETDGMSLADGLAHEHDRHPGFAPDHKERIARFVGVTRLKTVILKHD